MVKKPLVREVNPIFRRIRDWALGFKDFRPTHRYEGYMISPRTMPNPNLPGGCSSARLSDNYYLSRDGRRESEPPTKIFVASSPQKLIEGEKGASQKSFTPGFSYNWETGKFES